MTTRHLEPSPDQQRAFGIVYLGLSWSREHGSDGHLSAQELVLAMADAAEERWGLMAPIVLDYYGLGSSEAIGQVVEEMVNRTLLRRSPTDRQEDFNQGPSLTERFSLNKYKWHVKPADMGKKPLN